MSEIHFHRRNLPHLYSAEGIYFITFRLADSLPQSKVAEIKLAIENKELKDVKSFERLLKKYDNLLDSGHYGNKYLLNSKMAEICKQTLHYPDKKDYNLICYCIMPNHVHLVFELLKMNKGISKIMQSIKRISARKSNQILNRTGKFWQDESYDRLVRDDKELYFIIRYVLMNPVNAGFTDDWNSWKYSYCIKEYIVL
jgi:REP element-mobilizing transposase RayT